VRRTQLGSREDGTRMTMAMSVGRKKMARITQPRLGQPTMMSTNMKKRA